MILDCQINGTQRVIDILPFETLAEVLRERMGLTGTKVSCEVQVCGSCTVLLDGMPVSSCTVLGYEANSKSVLTVEGLEDSDGTLNTLQEAFIENFALQCGFCTSGMLMTATWLINNEMDLSRDDIRRHMDGNLCRCTGYVTIVDAIEQAYRSARETADRSSGS